MIARTIANKVNELLGKYPIESITEPLQSGKTTLTRMLGCNYQYVSLENLSNRLFAQQDLVFWKTYQNGILPFVVEALFD